MSFADDWDQDPLISFPFHALFTSIECNDSTILIFGIKIEVEEPITALTLNANYVRLQVVEYELAVRA